MNYNTYGELLEDCRKCKTKEEANEVLKKAEEDNPKWAKSDIGYLLGYLGEKERNRLYGLFEDCSHPVFGHGFGREKDVSMEEAFEIGTEIGKKLRKEAED